MKIKAPKFMRKIAAKYVSNAISKEAGVNIDIDLHDLTIDTKGINYSIHTEQTFVINKRDLKRIIKEGL